MYNIIFGLPRWLSSKESACNAGVRVPSLSQEDPLEKETATYSIILAWKIPWTKEPSGLTAHRIAKSLIWLRHNNNIVFRCTIWLNICMYWKTIPTRSIVNSQHSYRFPLQYSCLQNPMDGGAWWATVHRVANESDRTERLHFTSWCDEIF